MTTYLPTPHSCHLQWHVTEKCNFHCTHCYLTEEYLKNELSTEECLKIVDMWVDYCKKLGITQHRNLTLSGGEPILKKDWWKILEYVSEYKKKGLINRFYIMTNGSTVTDEIIKRYLSLGVNYMQISVEGMEKVNDEIRGKGNFKKAVEGAKIILKNGMPLSFSLTLTKKNIGEVEPLARFAATLGIGGLGTGRIVPIGGGSQMKDLTLTPEETREWYLEVEKINERLRRDKINFQVDYHCSDSLYNTIRPDAARTNPQTGHGCSTPFDVFTLMPNGDVFPCRRLPILIGNVKETTFVEMYYASNKMWQLKNWNNSADECQNCNYLKICRGSGKCIAFGYFGTPHAPDPGCWYLFNGFPKKKYPKEKDEDKITYFQRYIKNLRFDLEPLDLKETKRKMRIINLNKLDKVKENEIDLISFEFEEKDLNINTGERISRFLEQLEEKKISFQIAKPLPPCIFDLKTQKQFGKYNLPKNCLKCPSLFRLEGKRIILCDGRKGPDYKYMNNQEQIWEFFEMMKEYDEPTFFNKCKTCIHKMRGTCYFIHNCTLKPLKPFENKLSGD
ncbi:MAG: radical SAM protein [Nanoarchaeota archaeon]|nr:radical SAM protein [Nanoarchaeota archaeon]